MAPDATCAFHLAACGLSSEGVHTGRCYRVRKCLAVVLVKEGSDVAPPSDDAANWQTVAASSVLSAVTRCRRWRLGLRLRWLCPSSRYGRSTYGSGAGSVCQRKKVADTSLDLRLEVRSAGAIEGNSGLCRLGLRPLALISALVSTANLSGMDSASGSPSSGSTRTNFTCTTSRPSAVGKDWQDRGCGVLVNLEPRSRRGTSR